MQDQQKQLIDKLKGSQNVLVTVSKDPTVDQLAAAIGLTLALNKLDKHATAVFSGQIPSTIEFLKPEDTLETTTDSLRDFIIALDKSKADKLRYKVEDQVVRIFITPYRTSISERDLDFSQGDFNVDVVVALGVQDQQHIDDAIQAHGRILHDAAVAVLAFEGAPEIGTLNIVDSNASSLSEMVAGLVEALDHKLFDNQIATALLTGIVARTNRFSNDRTTPKTMSISSVLMAAGANQQLIASELETSREPGAVEATSADNAAGEAARPAKEPGTLEIDHGSGRFTEESNEQELVEDYTETEEPVLPPENPAPQVHVSEDGRLVTEGGGTQLPEITGVHSTEVSGSDVQTGATAAPREPLVTRERIIQPPSRDSLLSANVHDEDVDVPAEQLTQPSHDLPLLSHDNPAANPLNNLEDSQAPSAQLPDLELPPLPPLPSAPETTTSLGSPLPPLPEPAQSAQPAMPFAPPVVEAEGDTTVDTENETLTEIERAVHSPHIDAAASADHVSVDEARNAVAAALSAADSDAAPAPIAALNAQPLGPELHPEQYEAPAPQSQLAPMPGMQPAPAQSSWANPADQAMDMPLPTQAPASSFPGVVPQQSNNNDTMLPPPPPVPPPPIFPS